MLSTNQPFAPGLGALAVHHACSGYPVEISWTSTYDSDGAAYNAASYNALSLSAVQDFAGIVTNVLGAGRTLVGYDLVSIGSIFGQDAVAKSITAAVRLYRGNATGYSSIGAITKRSVVIGAVTNQSYSWNASIQWRKIPTGTYGTSCPTFIFGGGEADPQLWSFKSSDIYLTADDEAAVNILTTIASAPASGWFLTNRMKTTLYVT